MTYDQAAAREQELHNRLKKMELEEKAINKELKGLREITKTENLKRKMLGKRSKQRGNAAETYIVNMLKELDSAFAHAITTRWSSTILDNCAIDINNVPFRLQLKAGEHTGINHMELIRYMDNQCRELLPPDSPWFNTIRAVIHLRIIGAGNRRDEFHDDVTLTLKDFLTLIKLAYGKDGKNSSNA
jgi:hypothetical protein